MKIQKKLGWLLILTAPLALFGGCGDGNDPLNLFGDTTQVPTMLLPIRPADTTSAKRFSATETRDGIDLLAIGSARVRSPASGVVVNVSTDSTGVSVTIYVNPQIAARVSLLSSTTLRIGDYITQGQDMGIPGTSLYTRFSVLVNGTAVCPYSYLDTDGRDAVNSHIDTSPPYPCVS